MLQSMRRLLSKDCEGAKTVTSLSVSENTDGNDENTALITSIQDDIDDIDDATPAKPHRRVPDSLPAPAWLMISIELCERFAYFGITGPLQNYIQRPYGDSHRPGGLGLGQANASRINQLFSFTTSLTPLLGAILADQYFGRLNTILYASVFYILGLCTLFASSLPIAHLHGLSFAGLLTSLFLLSIGTGGIKPNVIPLIAEQYTGVDRTVQRRRSGEIIVLDRELTLQRIFAIFYFFINVVSLSPIGTTILEQQLGFPSAFALPTVVFIIGLSLLIATRKRLVSELPRSSVLSNAFKVLWIGITHGCLEAAKPSHLGCTQNNIQWDDAFVDELARALRACRLFLFFPLYWMAWLQTMSNFISQAGTMETHGIPNDILTNLGPLTVIAMVPLLEQLVYPLLRRIGIMLEPISRITFGFILISIAMAYAAVLQYFIYASPPCYNHPRAADCFNGDVPNQIHVAVQAPAYILVALSEVFAVPTGYKWAFTKAPSGMRSLVMALFLLTVACGALLAVLFSPLAVDPKLTWMYGGLSGAALLSGLLFWLVAHEISKPDIGT